MEEELKFKMQLETELEQLPDLKWSSYKPPNDLEWATAKIRAANNMAPGRYHRGTKKGYSFSLTPNARLYLNLLADQFGHHSASDFLEALEFYFVEPMIKPYDPTAYTP